jgi:hypothetical protein
MNQFFNNLWNNIKHGYCFARDYIANKVARVNNYGDLLIEQANVKDDFTKRLQGMLCKAAAFVMGFTVAFAVGYTIGFVFTLVFGPILGLIAIPLAYLVGDDFGSAIAREIMFQKVANMLERNLGLGAFAEEMAAA